MRFIVTNDPGHAFDLMLEAYRGDELIADVRCTNTGWKVGVYANETGSYVELSHDDFALVYAKFGEFIAGRTNVGAYALSDL